MVQQLEPRSRHLYRAGYNACGEMEKLEDEDLPSTVFTPDIEKYQDVDGS